MKQSVCDSVTMAQSNQIIRLEGEVNKERSMKNLLLQVCEGKDSTYTRHERFLENKLFDQADKAFKSERTFIAAFAGAILIFTTIFYIKK